MVDVRRGQEYFMHQSSNSNLMKMEGKREKGFSPSAFPL